jgi:hypothetical protein
MRGKIVVLSAGLCLLLGACAAGPGEPSALPAPAKGGTALSASPTHRLTPSPSSSRSEAPPLPIPTGTDLQQAIATAKLYYAESNRAINTGDTSRLRAMSTRDCPCLAIVNNIDEVWKDGSIRAPQYYTVTSLGSTAVNPDRVTAVINAETHFDRRGKRISFTPAQRGLRSVFMLEKQNSRWTVYDLQRYE